MLVLLNCNGIKMYFFLVTYLSSQNDRQTERLSGEMVNLAVIFQPCENKENHRKRGNVLLLYNFTVSLQSYCGQNSWDKFSFLGLSFNHTCPTPPPTPQTTLDVCIQNFSRDSTFYRVGRGRTARYFPLCFEGTQ